MQATKSFELALYVRGICVSHIECDVTISLEDDGFGDLSWNVVQIDAENLEGTGWLRWTYEDVKEHTAFGQIGNALFQAALNDPLVDEYAAAEWQAYGKEAA